MCGIIGYVGAGDVRTILLEGLKRLEYRGYDSSGIAVMSSGAPTIARSVGGLSQLEGKVKEMAFPGNRTICGIGHTRWATHGRPTEENAHPIRDCSGHFAVVHNGIIENHAELRQRLIAQGHIFQTSTDTEVLPHLFESCFNGNLEHAVLLALQQLEGTFAIAMISSHAPQTLIAARNGSPLVIGIGDGESFISSDMHALMPYTPDVVLLNDGEVAIIRSKSLHLMDLSGRRVQRKSKRIEASAQAAERGGFDHFMLKEIFEQPYAIRNTYRNRVNVDDGVVLEEELGPVERFQSIRNVIIVACGTSRHAALIGEFVIESFARLPVEVDFASEFRYRDLVIGPDTMVIGVTQSGETADTIGAMTEARTRGALVLAICNVSGSMAERLADCTLFTRSGPEIGVASTKTFTAQLTAFYLLALFLARLRGTMPQERIRQRTKLLNRIPENVERILDDSSGIEAVAQLLCSYTRALYLGRGINYPIALEGALKLKELSYIHAEGYPSGEMKHGPIALIDSRMPVIVVASRDSLYRKTMANLEEIKARDGLVFAIAAEGDQEISAKADYTLRVPEIDDFLNPMLNVLPLQLLAYHAARLRDFNVDRPRNLAKCVTVE